MEQTPPTRVLRQRHTPTPKMSERKKKLFASTVTKNLPSTIDEDSDLGPMSPLQFSCSPSSYDANQHTRFMMTRESRTDFSNIMLQLSPMSANQQTASRSTPTKSSQHRSTSATYERVHDSPVNSQSSDMFALEKENCIESAQKTPNTADVPARNNDPIRVSFRKSLIFDTGMTPDESYLSPKSKKCLQKRVHLGDDDHEDEENPRARASLSFGQPQISVKSFYGATSTGSAPVRKSTSGPSLTQSKAAAKKKTKKNARFGGPTLGNKGVVHKIRPKQPPMAGGPNKGVKNPSRLIEAAINILGSRCSAPATEDRTGGSSKRDDEQTITREQISKLQRILQNQRKTSELSSRPLNWTGSQSNMGEWSPDTSATDLNDTTFGETSGLNSSALNTSTASSTSPDPEPLVVEKPAEEPKRKFFKSRTPSTSNTYTIMKGVCATVKRGSGVALLDPPKSKKSKHNDEYYELKALKEDVSNIIDMLVNSDDEPVPAIVSGSTEPTLSAPAAAPVADDLIPADSAYAMDMQTDQYPVDDELIAHQDYLSADLASHLNYEQFAQRLPYNTTDPEVQQRQETLLNLLYTNNICNEENFKIFIAEPTEHEDEAARILEQLFVLDIQEPCDVGMDSSEDVMAVPMSPASQISTMTLGLALGSPKMEATTAAAEPAAPSAEPSVEASAEPATSKVFPVFEKNHAAKVSSAAKSMSEQLDDEHKKSKLSKWKPIGNNQYQLDAGQKKFGGSMCSCGMFYSVHEPEDEELHQKYHDIYNQLKFLGWVEERVVCSVPEWGIGARIICVTDLDTKMKRNRCSEIVALVDRELGYADIPTKPQSIIYLAITKRQVIGICVAEPQPEAHPLITKDGVEMMDLSRKCAVKCGISRIWVAGPHRRHGIAMRMFNALRSHFIRGYTLRLSEVAFSSPTEMGRSFAGRVSDTVLVY